VVDSHCHIAGPEFAGDLDGVIDRARAAGLERALVILAADNAGELRQFGEVVRRWPAVRAAIGVHPHAAGAHSADAAAQQVQEAIDAQPLTRALGEIGLDYHNDVAPRDVQSAVFEAQLDVARRRGLPVVIHSREADDDTLRLIWNAGNGHVRGVFHCFTGDRDMARKVLDAGFHISLSGIVTFPKALELHDVARLVPEDRLLVETDSPFLAPVPHRGKRNEPAYVVRVLEAVAKLREAAPSDLGSAVTENFRRVFTP
jgi:TatD DNase family protein